MAQATRRKYRRKGIVPSTTSDALAQSTDFFPTLLELTQVAQPAGVKFDGASFAPALRGEALKRDTIFSHFPHGGRSDIEGFRPATWVRRGDWKLIRFFADNDDGSDKLELYNLRDDISETKNLAVEKAELAQELNALIAAFLKDTEAVVPVRNPNFRSGAPGKAPVPAKDPLLGWKARACDAAVKDGIMTVTGKGDAPFLGFAAGKATGPTVVRFRVRTTTDGAGKVEWLHTPQAADAAKSVAFKVTGGDWQEVSVPLPAEGALGIVRLYLPAQNEPVQLDWIEFKPGEGKPHRSDF